MTVDIGSTANEASEGRGLPDQRGGDQLVGADDHDRHVDHERDV
jgi:hypothetical protein